MNQELVFIKKKYGEKMMHLCRDLFATILDNSPNFLSQILLETFHPTHYLYEDLLTNDAITSFKEYIYSYYDKLLLKENLLEQSIKVADPVTLMRQAGYTLYECITEEDIQQFKKYYAQGEELCTFNGGRLNRCHVYFAVKDDAEKLNRQNYSHPDRQDEYGTSVISIQFTRDDSHTLSIKNRYNHTVINPDATFSNDLDNIIPGLTQSFADHYDLEQKTKLFANFELPGYVRANDGKFYKYNYEVNNTYYCPDNVIINHFRISKLPKDRYLVFEYFVLDLVNKNFLFHSFYESFPDTIGTIKKINILNNNDGKTLIITPVIGEDIIIELDKYNRITSYKNNNVKTINSDFLTKNKVLNSITLNNVTSIDNNFLHYNRDLTSISLPKVLKIGNNFLYNNENISTIDLPNVIEIGDSFMRMSDATKVSLPKVITIGSDFMRWNTNLHELELPSVISINANFLSDNSILSKLSLPNVRQIGCSFLFNNNALKELSLPNLESIYKSFCYQNTCLENIYLPNVRIIASEFLCYNNSLKTIELPKVLTIGPGFLHFNVTLNKAILPSLRSIERNALVFNKNIQEFYAPRLTNKHENQHLNKLVKKSKPKLYQRFFKK